MDYQKHYDRLVAFRRHHAADGYTEKHHIKPKCLGGKDNKENLVRLTAEEHFMAHKLLAKIHPKRFGLLSAVMLMSESKTGERLNNKLYGWLRRRFSKTMSSRVISESTIEKLRQAGKGRSLSADAIEKLRNINTGTPRSKETRSKISQSRMGITPSKESRRKMSESHKGKPSHNLGKKSSDEIKAKLSAAHMGKSNGPHSAETRAKMSEGIRAYWVRRRSESQPSLF